MRSSNCKDHGPRLHSIQRLVLDRPVRSDFVIGQSSVPPLRDSKSSRLTSMRGSLCMLSLLLPRSVSSDGSTSKSEDQMDGAASLQLEVGNLLVVTPIPHDNQCEFLLSSWNNLHGFTGKNQPLLLGRDTGLLLDFLLCLDDLLDGWLNERKVSRGSTFGESRLTVSVGSTLISTCESQKVVQDQQYAPPPGPHPIFDLPPCL